MGLNEELFEKSSDRVLGIEGNRDEGYFGIHGAGGGIEGFNGDFTGA